MTLLYEPEIRVDVIYVAPGEEQRPLSLFKDPNAEYLAFPTFYAVNKNWTIRRNSQMYITVIYASGN